MNRTPMRSNARAAGVLAAALLATAAIPLGAQPDPDYVYSAPDLEVAPGSTFEVPILLDSSNGSTVKGLSYSLCFDSSVIALTDVVIGADTMAYSAPNGSGPDYLLITQGSDFIRFGVVLQFSGFVGYPPAADLELTVATFDAVGGTGSTTPLQFCAAGVPPLELVVVPALSGLSIEPVTDDGSVTISDDLGSYSLTLPPATAMGLSFDAMISIDATMPIDGVRLGLSHDAAQVLPIAAVPSAPLAAMNGGQGPDQLLVELFPGTGPGITIDCLFDTAGIEMLPAGNSDLFVVTYEALYLPQSCAAAPFEFTADLGVGLEVAVAGGSVPVTGVGGSLPIAPGALPPPSGGVSLEVGTTFISQVGIAEVPVTLDSDVTVQGFSFGAMHDDPTVTLLDIVPGSLVTTLGCGDGPAFFEASIPEPNSYGVVVAVADFDPTANGNQIPVGSGVEIARLVYQTTPGSLPMQIDLVGGLGSPPVALEVTANFVSLDPWSSAGLLLSGVPFIRGECNLDGTVNLADAIRILNHLFPVAPQTPIGCFDACDANDDGLMNLGDAVTILGALFGNATIAGETGCFIDETPDDALHCVDSGSCD